MSDGGVCADAIMQGYIIIIVVVIYLGILQSAICIDGSAPVPLRYWPKLTVPH